MIYSNRKFNPAAFSQRKLVAGIAAPPIIRMRPFPRHRGLGGHVESIIKIEADRGKDRGRFIEGIGGKFEFCWCHASMDCVSVIDIDPLVGGKFDCSSEF